MKALLLLALAAAHEPPSRTLYEVDARVSADLETIDGAVDASVVNDSGETVRALTVWLYPQTFAREPTGITELNRDHYEPFAHPRGGMSISSVRVGDREATAQPLDLAAAPPGTALLLPLPEPLLPGQAVRVRLRFHVDVPHRLGPFGRAAGVLTALGGWFPYLTATDPGAADERERLPPPADFRVRVAVPRRYRALVGGVEPQQGTPVYLEHRPFVDLALRPAAIDPIRTRGGTVWPISRRPAPAAADVGGLPLPPALASSWPGEELERLLRNLDEWADARPGIPDPGELDLVLVPMRSELALPTAGMVAISDRAYAVPSWEIAERFHARAIARAYLARRFLPLTLARERPADALQIADALGALFAERFVAEVMGDPADLHGVLSELDFIPGVDSYLRTPKSAFPHVYLRPAAEPIPVRDEPWTFTNEAPRGKVILEKLRDRLGEPGLERAVERYLRPAGPCVRPAPGPGAAPCGLRRAAEAVAGRDLSVFFATWMSSLPAEDLRTLIASTRSVGDEVESEVVVYRVGDTPPEVIEVAARDAGGRRFTLVWNAQPGEVRRVFTVRSPDPVVSLQVDPRRRVAQTPEHPTDTAVRGDTVPERVQLLLTYLNATYSTTDQLVYGNVRFLLRGRGRLDRRLGFGASLERSRVSGYGAVSFGFGPLVDAAQYRYNLGLALSAAHLRQGFGGEETSEGWATGLAVSFGLDDRPQVPEPREGSAFVVAADVNAGVNDAGFVPYASALVGYLHLFPLSPHQSLALRLKVSAVTSDTPVQELIPLGGTDQGLRGFTLQEVLSERRALASLEWRHTLVADMDVDLGLVRWRGVNGALFADVAVVGGIRTPADAPPERLFGDVGYGLDFRYDFLGVRPLVVGVDVGVPIGRLPSAPRQLPFTFTIRALQSFSGL